MYPTQHGLNNTCLTQQNEMLFANQLKHLYCQKRQKEVMQFVDHETKITKKQQGGGVNLFILGTAKLRRLSNSCHPAHEVLLFEATTFCS